MIRVIKLAIVSVIAVGAASVGSAQAAKKLSQLDGRASPSLRAQVTAIADSTARSGLPVGPLVDKTLEGISKGADDQRIIAAVRGIASELGVARRALGPSSDDELTAAVAALRAGSSAGELAELRHALPGRPLIVPLSVLASLLVDGTPSPSAIVAVVSAAKRRNDVDLLAYGRGVSRDIASGVAPLTAISGALSSATSAPVSYPTVSRPSIPLQLPPKPKP